MSMVVRRGKEGKKKEKQSLDKCSMALILAENGFQAIYEGGGKTKTLGLGYGE